ncbi:hypothetical protein [Phenylobacterium sp. J367]|uniref:hypothetical protein n=1 Tax=Phenylobacterium sp. J367 TaxID=2898435 RepID=UPI002151B6D9|nr:hypothetical protein [Phenylobacterium sp. J367]MCR5879199.1 hypothetical protein [Phenylobacterium sp. J367]
MSQQTQNPGRDQTDRVSGDQVEGSLTDGGAQPGPETEDRSFGAGREAETGKAPKVPDERNGVSGPPDATAGQTSGEGG